MAAQTVMYAITIALHGISIGLYFYVAYCAWKRPDLEISLKITMIGGCSFAVLLSCIFSALQIDWMLTNKHELVGDDLSYAWLVFDYLLVIYLITMGQVLHVITRWSRSSGRRRHFAYPGEPWLEAEREGRTYNGNVQH